MKRLAVFLLLILSLFAAGVPAAFGQSCATPPPTATRYPSYATQVAGTQGGHLLSYWILDETSGTTAQDTSGNSRNGTYSGVALNNTTSVDGRPAGTWDGVNDFINVFSSSLQSAFSPTQGTILAWAKTSSWADGANRRLVFFSADLNNYFSMWRNTTLNNFRFDNAAGGTLRRVENTSLSGTSGWFLVVITWNKTADQLKAYYISGQTGTTQTGLGTFSGSLSATGTVIGALDTTGAQPWSGSVAHVAVWNVALNATEIAALATVPPYYTPVPTATLCASWTPTPTYTPTPSPTWTPTYTPTPTNTPNIRTYLTVIPPGSSSPGQDVMILHEISLGSAMIASLLFAIVVILVLQFARQMRQGQGA